ncbi:hypothetical protein QQX98_003758 [Neonectria punicea]|uniref:DUF7053 domain-containing protein n=1 Tax=Neonectria punicea TaxID=979145 RepID=A0ABR1HCB6_9HYPO
MRSEHRTSISIPIPNHVPPQVVLAFVQTFTPTMRLNDHVAGFEEIPTDPSSLPDDAFFGPCNRTLRSFQIREVTQLAPGINREATWPVAMQCIPNGINCRAKALMGTIVWARWTVRQRHPEDSPTRVGEEEWELHDEVLVHAHSLMMPFTKSVIHRAHYNISQRMVDEVVKGCFDGTMYQ